MRWSQVNLKKFQELDSIEADNDWDTTCLTICIVYNLTPAQLNNVSVRRFKRLSCAAVSLLSTTPTSKVKRFIFPYFINYDIKSFKWRQYVEIQHFFKHGLTENIHNILASSTSYNPKKGHVKRAKRFLSSSSPACIAAAQEILKNIAEINLKYLPIENKKEENEVEEEENEVEPIPQQNNSNNFDEVWGWMYATTQVMKHRGINLEETWELTVQQVMNDLLFIRALREKENSFYATQTEQ